jgi:hypothetical protein
MAWDIHINCGQHGDYNHYSESLAINPDQIAEHRKHFPDVDVLPNGVIHFTSFKQHDNYCEKTGFAKQTQKLKPKKATVKA